MKTVDNERTVTGATSLQRNVDGLLQAHCTCNEVDWMLYQLEGHGACIHREQQIVAIPRERTNKEVFKLTLEMRKYGWHTQIGVIK